jgi:hypothetical protein
LQLKPRMKTKRKLLPMIPRSGGFPTGAGRAKSESDGAGAYYITGTAHLDPRLSNQARTWMSGLRSRAGRQVRVERSRAHLHHRGPGLQLDPRLSYQTRTWSQTGQVRVGRSGGQQAPYAANQVRSRTHTEPSSQHVDVRSRAGPSSPSRTEREPHTPRTWTGAGPNADPDPGPQGHASGWREMLVWI